MRKATLQVVEQGPKVLFQVGPVRFERLDTSVFPSGTRLYAVGGGVILDDIHSRAELRAPRHDPGTTLVIEGPPAQAETFHAWESQEDFVAYLVRLAASRIGWSRAVGQVQGLKNRIELSKREAAAWIAEGHPYADEILEV